jgi:predicted Ser/Thr protein kinase
MDSADTTPRELAGRWRSQVVLKRDVFSTVERGWLVADKGEVAAVLRRIDGVPWWSFGIARHFLNREARALAIAGRLDLAPALLFAGRRALVRGWIDGLPLHIAKPIGDVRYFRSAKAALRRLHRAGVTHNDLAKEQNWLRTPDGRAMLTDFQLATRFARRGALFRLAAYEDLRHLLKHKRRYAPDALTAAERKVLARKSWLTRAWMASGKRVYYLVTRGLLNFTDREGGGPRLVNDAPAVAARLKSHPGVRDAAVVAFPDRRSGTGLYAFVEADAASDVALIDFVAAALGRAKAPERLQVVQSLPRKAGGEVRAEILQLIAMNQVDLIDPLIQSDAEREVVARIVAGRRNLRDRFAF